MMLASVVRVEEAEVGWLGTFADSFPTISPLSNSMCTQTCRYKTRLCSFGRNCNRAICFFAHSADELRCAPSADDATNNNNGKGEVDERDYLMQVRPCMELCCSASTAWASHLEIL